MDALHKGHRERLRLRLESGGLTDFQQHEILEFLLYFADARNDMNPLAHQLIDRFGSLEAVLAADEAALRAIKGVGARKAAWLKRVAALVNGYRALQPADRPPLNNLRQVRLFAGQWFAGIDREEAWQLCLSKSGRLLLSTRLADSAAWGEQLSLRDGLGEVLSVDAHSVILLQLTGARPPAPEAYDIERTHAYAQTLTAVGVSLLDHVLISGEAFTSMAHAGLLDDLARPEAGTGALMERYLEEA